MMIQGLVISLAALAAPQVPAPADGPGAAPPSREASQRSEPTPNAAGNEAGSESRGGTPSLVSRAHDDSATIEREFREAVQQAQQAWRDQDVARAREAYRRALDLKPGSSDVAYNLGLAEYSAGDFAKAAELFAKAAQSRDADLAARSMYNRGRVVLDQSVGSDGGADPAALGQAIEQVRRALTHFKDASAANPADRDARINAEAALRLIRQLEQQQQQQQQQNQQQQDQQQNQQQQQQDQQQQPQQQDQQQNQEQQQQQQNQQQQQQDQQQPQQQDQQQNQEQQQQQNQQQQQQDQQQPPQQQDQQQNQEQQQQQNQQQQQQAGRSQEQIEPPESGAPESQPELRTEMNREEAERLLQLVRDKEKKRREQRRSQERLRQAPAERDW